VYIEENTVYIEENTVYIEENTVYIEDYTRQDHPMENTETSLQYYKLCCKM